MFRAELANKNTVVTAWCDIEFGASSVSMRIDRDVGGEIGNYSRRKGG